MKNFQRNVSSYRVTLKPNPVKR